MDEDFLNLESDDEEQEDGSYLLLDYYYRSLQLDNESERVFVEYLLRLLNVSLSDEIQDKIIQTFIEHVREINAGAEVSEVEEDGTVVVTHDRKAVSMDEILKAMGGINGE